MLDIFHMWDPQGGSLHSLLCMQSRLTNQYSLFKERRSFPTKKINICPFAKRNRYNLRYIVEILAISNAHDFIRKKQEDEKIVKNSRYLF